MEIIDIEMVETQSFPSLTNNKKEEKSSGNLINKGDTLIAVNRPSDPLLIQLQDQVNQLKEQISTLKKEVENPTDLKDKVLTIESESTYKHKLLRTTVVEIVKLLNNASFG